MSKATLRISIAILVAFVLVTWRLAEWEKGASIASIAADLATAVAVLVGGGWAFYQYLLRRAGETGLSLDTSVAIDRSDAASSVVFCSITLTNVGHARLTARPTVTDKERTDLAEDIRFACSLQVRRIDGSSSEARAIDWWQDQLLSVPTGLQREIDLLWEYRREEGLIFFLEPDEKYDLSCPLLLPPGRYLGKVHFFGTNPNNTEFWSRLFFFRVDA